MPGGPRGARVRRANRRGALADRKPYAKEVHRSNSAVTAGATANGTESGQDRCFTCWKLPFASLERVTSIASEPVGARIRAPRASRVSRLEPPDDSSAAGGKRRGNTPRKNAAQPPRAAPPP